MTSTGDDDRSLLEAMQRALRIAGELAHDFNNLLGGLFGYIDIARELSESPEKSRMYLEKALRTLDRAKDLSGRLHSFSKICAPDITRCTIGKLIDEPLAPSRAERNSKARPDLPANLASCEIDHHRGEGNVLVMDDEDFVLEIASTMLDNMGYRVTTACHGEETVQKYRAALERGNPFDLVILDLTIPGGMGGAATCEQLRVLSPTAKIIASSGYSNDPVMANPAEYNFDATLNKPYLVANLSAVLSHLLIKRQ